jgi:putative peptide zinc metalloprotease protein
MTTSPEHTTRERPVAANGASPQLADGVELLGEFEDSGFKEPHYVARRSDGQMIQLSRLMHLIAEQADGRRAYSEIADRVTDELGRKVSADNVSFLVNKKLQPLGVLAQPDGTSPTLRKPDPLLALKFRAALVPPAVTRVLTSIFYPLFFPPVVIAVLGALIAADVWFFGIHGVGQSTRELIYNPILLLMVLGLVVVATAFHEIGHATALRYGGGEPGVMGAGVYIVWPAFYTDVTNAYRLDRPGRLRTDLGGVYFNAIFILVIVGAYVLTGFEPLLVLVLVQHMQIVQQMLPFLRLDGYYILSDLTGVPDMFTRIKPTLRSVLPGKEADKRVEELKPWVRRVTTGWVLALVPVLLFIFGLMIFNAPRMLATAWDSFFVQWDKIAGGGGLDVVSGGIQMLALALPLAGMTYSFGRIGKRMASGAWGWSEDSPLRRGLVVVMAAGLAASAAFVLLPNGDYRPLQPDERGTLGGGIRQFGAFTTGRPGLTEEREAELGGAPTERDAPRITRDTGRNGDERSTRTTPTDTGTGATETETRTAETETSPSGTTEADPAPTTETETTATTTETTETLTTPTTTEPTP